MTRDEAVEVAKVCFEKTSNWYATFIDTLIELDILKVEQPRTSRDTAITALINTRIDNASGVIGIKEAKALLDTLDTVGLTIVRKEDVK